VIVRVSPEAFSPTEALAAFAAGDTRAGACASFVGRCRGEGVHWLELEHYPGYTEAEIARLAAETVAKFQLLDLLVIHRVGRVNPGEPIVLVAALSAHRREAFAAVEHLMDYLKTDAPFWKREVRDDGARWIEPNAEDRRRREGHGP
jgi:molybdopterin synthase catalytic subunit